jgi:hypothetical protein
VIGYGVVDPGIKDVGNCSENAPLLPTVVVCLFPLMVIDTVSPLGANCVPLPITPASVTELVPAGIVCEAVNPLNVTGIGCTTMLPIDSSC